MAVGLWGHRELHRLDTVVNLQVVAVLSVLLFLSLHLDLFRIPPTSSVDHLIQLLGLGGVLSIQKECLPGRLNLAPTWTLLSRS